MKKLIAAIVAASVIGGFVADQAFADGSPIRPQVTTPGKYVADGSPIKPQSTTYNLA